MNRKNYVGTVVSAAALLFCLCQAGFSQNVSVTNLSYSLRVSDVVVHYDLNGPPDKSYDVSLVLKRDSEPYFKMQPKSVSGQVGTGEFAGRGREIVWHLYRDVPSGLDGNDYYFEVNASMIVPEKGGGIPWYYFAGGALVGGAAAVYFGTDLINKSGGANHLPGPPVRPPQ